MSLNLATMLRESALAYPDKPVALYDGGRLSYAELDALTDRFAVGLRASGVGPGETVGLQLPNIPQFLIAYFGMLKAGCIARAAERSAQGARGRLLPRRRPGPGAGHLGRGRR